MEGRKKLCRILAFTAMLSAPGASAMALELFGFELFDFNISEWDFSGTYLSAKVGRAAVTSLEANYKYQETSIREQYEISAGKNYSGAIGYRFSPNLRIEAEARYLESTIDSGTLDIDAGHFFLEVTPDFTFTGGGLNIYFDLFEQWPVVPYLMFGVGMGTVEIQPKLPPPEELIPPPRGMMEKDTVALFRLGAGFSYTVFDSLSLDLGYVYESGNNLDFGRMKFDFENHMVNAGLRYQL